jgi:GPI mannosyltransferase 3
MISTEIDSLGILMPCHSTPWMSHIHDDRLGNFERAWFLTCEPPSIHLDEKGRKEYRDQSDQFFSDPIGWLEFNFEKGSNLVKGDLQLDSNLYNQSSREEVSIDKFGFPSHLGLFESLSKFEDFERNLTVGYWLKDRGYQEVKRWWGRWPQDDDRKQGDVILLKKESNL